MLPHARRESIAGLLELINDRGGREDLPRVADELRLEEHFPDDEVERQIGTALNWGRYAGIFTYDSESDRLLAETSEGPIGH